MLGCSGRRPRFESWRGVEERSYSYVKLEIIIISNTVLSTKKTIKVHEIHTHARTQLAFSLGLVECAGIWYKRGSATRYARLKRQVVESEQSPRERIHLIT